MEKPFVFACPTKLVFGEGCVDSLSAHLAASERVFVVTGRGSALLYGHLKRIRAALSDRFVGAYSGVSANPRAVEVDEAAEQVRKCGASTVLGLGGGSAMDAAKAIAVGAASGRSIREFLLNDELAPPDTLPVVAVPTTAGTGSETSKAAIITDEGSGVKKGLRGDAIAPVLAIVDPELTYTVPELVAIETGFDVMTHALETWVSKKSNPVVANWSRWALAAAAKWLPAVKADLGDKEARQQLALASTLMGFNLANSSTCLPHRLQYPIGALTDTSHPAGLAAIYPAWCEVTANRHEEAFGFLASVLAGEAKAAGDAAEQISDFLSEMGIRYSLSDLGCAPSVLDTLVGAVEGNLENDPGDTSSETLLSIYRASL